MGRSGYSDNCENLELWRQAVHNAIHGKRGQAFLRRMATALDSMPARRLISGDLVCGAGVCAMGSVALAEGIDTSEIRPGDRDSVAELFKIAPALAAEIAFENDQDFAYHRDATPEQRWERMRTWVDEHLKKDDQ